MTALELIKACLDAGIAKGLLLDLINDVTPLTCWLNKDLVQRLEIIYKYREQLVKRPVSDITTGYCYFRDTIWCISHRGEDSILIALDKNEYQITHNTTLVVPVEIKWSVK